MITITLPCITPIITLSKKPIEGFVLDISPQVTRSWTFMLYLCGDTRDDLVTHNLDNSENKLFANMLSTVNNLVSSDLLAGSEADLNVIALFDQPYSTNYPHGKAELLKIERDNLTVLADYGETNMGHSATLTNFINYCKTHFPADNYALTLSDHGRGYAGFCYDYHAPHPYWEYALGDCLGVEELELALSLAGGVNTLFIDCCLGGSFELMWQLEGEVDYVVAAESINPNYALFHPRDILYNLSRDTSMDPLTLAYKGYYSSINPVLCPSNPESPSKWNTVAIYNLNEFDIPPPLSGLSLKDAFNQLSFYLFDEITYNISKSREIFGAIRSSLWLPMSLFESNSLMVDLGDFVMALLDHLDVFTNKIDIENYAYQVLSQIEPGKTIIDFHARYPYDDDNLTGFTLCFPESLEMYHEYLYPYFYYNLDISQNTFWEDFIFNLYPPNDVMFEQPKYEYFEVYLAKIDPTIHLHVYFDYGPFEEPLHIGYTSFPNANVGMNIEIGIEGASFQDNMIFGNTQIKVPIASLPALMKDNTKQIQVVVNASTASSTSRDVNLTIRHIDPTGVIWEDTKITKIEAGQIISTNVTTDNEWTDWDEISPPFSTAKFTGYTLATTSISISLMSFISLITIKRKKKIKKIL